MAVQADLLPLEAKQADVCMRSCPGGPSGKPTWEQTITAAGTGLSCVPGISYHALHREDTDRKLLGDWAKQGQTRISAGPGPPETTHQSSALTWNVSTFAEPNRVLPGLTRLA